MKKNSQIKSRCQKNELQLIVEDLEPEELIQDFDNWASLLPKRYSDRDVGYLERLWDEKKESKSGLIKLITELEMVIAEVSK